MLKAYDTPEIRIWCAKSASEREALERALQKQRPGGGTRYRAGPWEIQVGAPGVVPYPVSHLGPVCSGGKFLSTPPSPKENTEPGRKDSHKA